MTLKAPNGDQMTPIACIPESWCKPGFLVLQTPGGGFRTAYSVPDLLKHNPKYLIEGYMNTLGESFLSWLTERERACNQEDKTYRFEQGDIPPFWFTKEHAENHPYSSPDYYVEQPKDTRKEKDYLEIKFDEPVRCPKHTAKRRAR